MTWAKQLREGLRRASAALLPVTRICSNQPVSSERVPKSPERVIAISSDRPLVNCVLLTFLFSAAPICLRSLTRRKQLFIRGLTSHLRPGKVNGVRVILTPSLRKEALKYLISYDQILLADSIRQKGLRHEYRIAGQGTPLVIYGKNPESSLKEKHYPTTGISLGVTAVKEESPGQVPLLKLYDSFDPVVARSARGPNAIAANYTATLAVLNSRARKVAGSAAGSFLRPDNPRFATGIYLIHPYDPNKIPILFIHGLISSSISWQNLTNDLCSDPEILEHYQPWFFLYPTGQPVLESAAQLRQDLSGGAPSWKLAGCRLYWQHW